MQQASSGFDFRMILESKTSYNETLLQTPITTRPPDAGPLHGQGRGSIPGHEDSTMPNHRMQFHRQRQTGTVGIGVLKSNFRFFDCVRLRRGSH